MHRERRGETIRGRGQSGSFGVSAGATRGGRARVLTDRVLQLLVAVGPPPSPHHPRNEFYVRLYAQPAVLTARAARFDEGKEDDHIPKLR